MNILRYLKQYEITPETKLYYDTEYLDIDYTNLVRSLIIPTLDRLNNSLIPYYNIKNAILTRLLASSYFSSKYNSKIYLKIEGDNVTGSFKDRETQIAMNYVMDRKRKEIAICSSGNAAISAAYFANLNKIKCNCFVPSNISRYKLELIKKYNGVVHKYEGDYAIGYKYLANAGEKYGYNITPGILSVRTEANKSISYEIYNQLGDIPDYIVVPIGNGSCLTGIWKGFHDLMMLNITKKLPKFIGVCHDSSNPIKYALEEKKTNYVLNTNFKTFYAEGIIGSEAYCSPKVIHIISRGEAEIMEVDDDYIRNAVDELNKWEGILTEPTSAASLAIIPKLQLKHTDKVVFILTGRNGSNERY